TDVSQATRRGAAEVASVAEESPMPILRRPLILAALVTSAGVLTACSSERVVVSSSAAPDGITVTGVGEVQAPPDIARVHLGVDERAATAEQAVAQVTAKMSAVVTAVKGAGVADKDLRTSQLSVHREYQPPFEPP